MNIGGRLKQKPAVATVINRPGVPDFGWLVMTDLKRSLVTVLAGSIREIWILNRFAAMIIQVVADYHQDLLAKNCRPAFDVKKSNALLLSLLYPAIILFMKIVLVNNLTKKFKQFTAVNNISFFLQEGEILGLLGPNGAGKTTTIQMLLGVLLPTAGRISYFGKDFFQHREEILDQVNFSSTYTNLPWDLTVFENLHYTAYLYQITDRKKRINKIIDIFRLGKLVNQRLDQLSSGQITRVNLAKAFINFPKVLLLDEPTASLDPESARYIRDFLLSQRERFKVSIIFTSHNMAEVEEVCDRVIFINHGKIIADDTPANLARTIEICHVELNVPDGLKRTIEKCEKENLKYRLTGRYIIVDLKETKIPQFLHDLMRMGVTYNQIAIDKPTLEDYFIAKAKQSK